RIARPRSDRPGRSLTMIRRSRGNGHGRGATKDRARSLRAGRTWRAGRTRRMVTGPQAANRGRRRGGGGGGGGGGGAARGGGRDPPGARGPAERGVDAGRRARLPAEGRGPAG